MSGIGAVISILTRIENPPNTVSNNTGKTTIRIVKDIDQSWSVEDIAKRQPPPSWEGVFKDALPELEEVSNVILEDEKSYGRCLPLRKDIFRAFYLTRLDNVKVVIIGQDPYYQILDNGLPRATGLSFSVRREDVIPSSLTNIYKELKNDITGFVPPSHGCLEEWARQGVLMLNTCLTVRYNAAGSHGEIWLGFIQKVLTAICKKNPNVIFVLWGKESQKLITLLSERTVTLTGAYPSGRSAHNGFFGGSYFSKINGHLLKYGMTSIDWRLSN